LALLFLLVNAFELIFSPFLSVYLLRLATISITLILILFFKFIGWAEIVYFLKFNLLLLGDTDILFYLLSSSCKDCSVFERGICLSIVYFYNYSISFYFQITLLFLIFKLFDLKQPLFISLILIPSSSFGYSLIILSTLLVCFITIPFIFIYFLLTLNNFIDFLCSWSEILIVFLSLFNDGNIKLNKEEDDNKLI
jgi:hypothetical protein